MKFLLENFECANLRLVFTGSWLQVLSFFEEVSSSLSKNYVLLSIDNKFGVYEISFQEEDEKESSISSQPNRIQNL